jgi:hypothetical protein
MKSRFARAKRLRWIGISVLVCGAAIALSGCWATVYNTGVDRHLVVGSKATNQFIFICTGLNPGSTTGRDRCVMGLMRQTCLQQQEAGDQPWTDQNCYESTDEYQVTLGEVDQAINQIKGGADCFEIVHQYVAPLHAFFYFWRAQNRSDSTACAFSDS